MANLTEIKKIIENIQGDKLFNTAIVGSTSMLQTQANELRYAYAALAGSTKKQSDIDKFWATALAAHATSVISLSELDKIKDLLEEK